MGATISIFRRELGAYINTPIGYVFISLFLLLTCGIYVIVNLFPSGVADMREYFGLLPLFYMFFIPAIAMRLWAEERKLGTLELLLTMPVKSWHAVLGKYLAGLLFIAFALFLTVIIPLVMKFWLHGNPNPGATLGGYFGALVLGMIYLAIGSFASSLTSDQIVAFVVGVVLCAFFFLMGFRPMLDWVRDMFSPDVSTIIERFGVQYHFESIARGVLDTRDVIYAVSMTAMFLFLNVLVIERRR